MNEAFIIHASDLSAPREIPLALSGFPKEEAGQPCHYLKRELCPVGETRVHPDKGYKIDVPPARADGWINSFALMSERGHPVPAPPTHSDEGNSFGKWVSFTREPNARGGTSLFGVLKVVGDRNRDDVLNRDVSILTEVGMKDDRGNQYDEVIKHVACTPYPALTGLSGWTSIAASRGQAVRVPVFEMTTQQEPIMDLSKLREAVGAAKSDADDAVIQLALSRLTETATALDKAKADLASATPALELSRTQATTIATLTQERDAAKAMAAQQKPSEIPAELLAGYADLATQKIDLSLSRGQCTKAQADILKGALKDGDKPAVLMLSKSGPAGTPIDVALKVLELNKPFTGTVTGTQLDDPNAPADMVAAAATEAAEYQNRQLQARGFQAA